MQSLQALGTSNNDMDLNKMKFLSTPTQLGNFQASNAPSGTGGLNAPYNMLNYGAVGNMPSNLNEQSMHYGFDNYGQQ